MLFKRKDPAALQAQLTSMKGGYNNNDDKLWKPTPDANGNASAVIRILPHPDDELPFTKLINHSFKNNGKSYFANCTSTHGDYDSCPVCAFIKEQDLYDSNKQLWDKVKRKTNYWVNILVLKDPGCPENEGKVMKYRFGVKIMEKIQAQSIVDESLGQVPVDVTCVYGGANLLLKVKQSGGFPNYDDSQFMAPGPIPGIDTPEMQAKISEGMSDLSEIVAPGKFDSLEKNTEKFHKVMGTAAMGGSVASAAKQAANMENELAAFGNDMASYNAGAAPVEQPAVVVDLESELDMAMASTPGADTNAEFEALMKGLDG